jgi:hypothetical protein
VRRRTEQEVQQEFLSWPPAVIEKLPELLPWHPVAAEKTLNSLSRQRTRLGEAASRQGRSRPG